MIRPSHGRPATQSLLDPDDPTVGGDRDLGEQRLDRRRVGNRAVPVKAGLLALHRAQRLLQRLGEVAAQRHRLADALHRRRQGRVGGGELLEREPRHLDDDIVQGRLEGRRRLLGDVVGDLVKGVADRHLRGDLGDREAGRLRGQRRRARDPRVHLDDDDPAVVRVDCELDVAAPGVDADLANDGDADVAQPLVFAVGEGERRSHGDRVTRVDAHGVEVLDGADDHDVVLVVAHHLKFVLLPADDRLLKEHLGDRGVLQPGAANPAQVGLVVGEARPQTAHGEGRPHDDGVAQFLCRSEAFVHRVADDRASRLGPATGDDPLELLAVLAELDRLDVGSDERAVVALQHPALVQGHRAVERRLAAEGGQHRVRALLGDDRLDDLGSDRLDVGRVGELRVGHDRRRVGVDQDDADPFVAQHATRLGAGVVELAGLPNDDRAGPDDQDARDVFAPRHAGPPSKGGCA